MTSQRHKRSREKGRDFESAMVRLLWNFGLSVMRNTPVGRTEEDGAGDLKGLKGLHIECKSLRSLGEGVARGIDKACDKHQVGDIPVVIAKRPQQPDGRSIIGIEAKDFADFIRWARNADLTEWEL